LKVNATGNILYLVLPGNGLDVGQQVDQSLVGDQTGLLPRAIPFDSSKSTHDLTWSTLVREFTQPVTAILPCRFAHAIMTVVKPFLMSLNQTVGVNTTACPAEIISSIWHCGFS
ncbi:hypothetical protein ACFLU6_16005, partial [Acidobacteriota bacterium]